MGAFDMLKNMELDMIILIVFCLILNLLLVLDKLKVNGHDKINGTTFYPLYKLSKLSK
jgi:hypothetical protein